ncbi:MAG TPA: hypothetical protein ENL22_04810 [candidate division Zixibacteria bacterium]|nr:hypothetical protein [candidate division Zixibacteria bacterium]
MTEDREKKDKQAEEIVGLDDGDLKEEGGEKETPKQALLDKYKKFILPVAIALGAFVIAAVASKFLGVPAHEITEEVSVEESENSEMVDNIDKSTPKADLVIEELSDAVSIDTAAIMAELAFLDYTPEMEAEEKKRKQESYGSTAGGKGGGSRGIAGMTPQDSVDTLNWLQKELAKLDRAKAESARKIKELKALEYKIDQALIKIEQVESARITSIARLYDGMRPEQVGKLFENLDDKAVMAILPRMKSANAAKIMAIMPPKRAARISTKMITVMEK